LNDASKFADALPDSGLYPIRTVAEATGVNPVTLRAWERRYGLLKPKRTPKGHRLYSKDQIDTVRDVVRLLDQGMSISQVGAFLASEPANLKERANVHVRDDIWQKYQEHLLRAIDVFDAASLDGIFAETMALYPVDTVTERLTVPVLRILGSRWRDDPAGISTEHFFNAYLRNKLGARFHHAGQGQRGYRLVAACLPGEFHETGLLLFCLSASARGYQLVYLGANMPFLELPEVVRRSASDAVVLSAVARPRNRMVSEELPDLVRRLTVPLFVGGTFAVTHEKPIAASGANPIGIDIASALSTSDKALKNRPSDES
jgi:DNA-binding transcriptional MerR regulator